jgi:hypothetical protein
LDERLDELTRWEDEGGACTEPEKLARLSRIARIRRAVRAKGRDLLRGPWASLAALGAGLLVGSFLGRVRVR